MADMKKLLHTFDEADEILNDKIERTNLSTIVASATASVENKKTVSIKGTGRNIESLKIGGRTVQDGVPTPDVPVEVKGVGDKVENLFNSSMRNGAYKAADGTFDPSSADYICSSEMTEVLSSEEITVSSSNKYSGNYFIIEYDKNKVFIKSSRSTGVADILSTVLSERTKYIHVEVNNPSDIATISKIGTFVITYANGKYKIPVSCNGETTNIYLDSPLFDGESADLVGGIKDKKLKSFTIETIIEDDWVYIDDADHPWANRIYLDTKKSGYTSVFDNDYNDGCVPMCNYFKGQGTIGSGASTQDGCVNFGQLSNAKGMIRFGLYSSGIKSVSEFKAWLEARAAEGKPLTIWYESTEPTTESFDTSPIPTTSGNNELTINTEVTPVSIDITSFGDYYSKAEVDKMIPRISMLTYVGTGGTNTIKFPLFPTRIISMSGMAIDNNYIQSYPCDPKRVDSIKSKYYGGHMGEVSCSLSYDESESSITLTGGVDDGARFNVLGETYVVIYTY